MKLQILLFILFFLFINSCDQKNNVKNTSKIKDINCPDFYSKIEGVYWADKGFTVNSDTLHQYWYRLITFSEEEGFNIYVEKLRQGLSEGLGDMEVIERKNITHVKGLDDVNGISLHYHIKKWLNAKEVILELDSQDRMRSSFYLKSVNLETLSVSPP